MTGSLPNSLTGNAGFTAIVVADTTSNGNQVLGLGSSSATNFIRLQDSGKIGYTSSVSQTGSYNFYTAKSVGVWRKKADTNFDKGEFKLNGSDKGLTLSGDADATGSSVATHSKWIDLGQFIQRYHWYSVRGLTVCQ